MTRSCDHARCPRVAQDADRRNRMMSKLLFELPLDSAERFGDRPCLTLKGRTVDYAFVATQIERFASALIRLGSSKLARVAVFLPKQPETSSRCSARRARAASSCRVNPLLKPAQVAHILRDCNVRVLVTSPERAERARARSSRECPDLHHVILDDATTARARARFAVHGWRLAARRRDGARAPRHRHDMASILYTSGSTGKPKGVVLSHRNMVTGAHSVASTSATRRRTGCSPCCPSASTTASASSRRRFTSARSVVLMDYLLPRDVLIALVGRERVTGLAGVPPLWVQLADLQWPDAVRRAPALHHELRRRDAAGHARASCARRCRRRRSFLMYGLTEAFRSTYLPPDRVDRRPGFDGQGDPECGDPGRARRRHALARPTSRASWCIAARSSRSATGTIRQKTAERFKPAARAASRPGAARRWQCGRATRCAGTRRASSTSSAAATR